MRKSIKAAIRAGLLLFIVLPAFLAVAGENAPTNAVKPAEPATAYDIARMEQVIQHYVGNQSFMGAVLVAEKDKVFLSRGYGFADLEWKIPNSPRTKFRIGSITKQFTAACVLLLQEHGKIDLEAPLKTYLTNAPEAWAGVTVSHLLTHTSGLVDLTGLPEWNTYKRQNHTPEESIHLIQAKPLEFEPGAKFKYSNSNYILLGQIIERISGMPYADFLRQNILGPLGMLETGADDDAAILPERARGYQFVPDGFRHADYVRMTIPAAAGCLYSTGGDLLKWERALFGGKVLGAASLQRMISPQMGGYGMGLFIKGPADHGVITHNGAIEGFDASLNFYPEKQLTIVVLGNVKTDAPDKIADQLGKVAHGEKVVVNSDRKVVAVAASVLADYVGHYSAPPFGITISVEEDRLIATNPAGTKYVLHPESPTQFFLKEIDVQLEFIRDPATKKVTEFMMTQEGTQKRVPKDKP